LSTLDTHDVEVDPQLETHLEELLGQQGAVDEEVGTIASKNLK
jgi:hypothetical protein